MNAANGPGVPRAESLGKLVWMASSPHGGGFFISRRRNPNLGEHVFSYPLTEFTVFRKQRPPLIESRARGQPALHGVSLATLGPDCPRVRRDNLRSSPLSTFLHPSFPPFLLVHSHLAPYRLNLSHCHAKVSGDHLLRHGKRKPGFDLFDGPGVERFGN
ncbi:MAG: hypothetical protein KDK08_04135 [Rhizobiaceae bacterium]|nr:hypothetical protein [Rhizobiaceae bacterium]